jgi:hypothetical protein
MKKIASPQELQTELHKLLAYCERKSPSRALIASRLYILANRVRTADDVGKIILEQMGGYGRLKAMIGAQVAFIHNGVAIQWPSKQRSKGNRVEIVLQPSDTYEMTFYNVSGASKKPVKKYDDIYNDQLIELFEHQTGYYLHL